MPSFNTTKAKALADAAGDDTLEKISQRTGLDTALLSRLLRGERQPTFTTFVAYAKAYSADADDLIQYEAAA